VTSIAPETTGKPRCLLADDHPALLAAIRQLLAESGFEVVGPAANGERALALAREERPDIALVDYRMPRLSGVELLRLLKEEAPDTKVVVYTAEADDVVVRDCLEAGAAGIVLKEAPLADLLRALETIIAGRSYIDPGLARINGPHGTARNRPLTAREIDVLRLLAEGLSHEEIGSRLSISSETVRTHVRKAADRLGAATRTQAVAMALRSGIIV
jgi:DNA-binding NarL/FixJ family response regulator